MTAIFICDGCRPVPIWDRFPVCHAVPGGLKFLSKTKGEERA